MISPEVNRFCAGCGHEFIVPAKITGQLKTHTETVKTIGVVYKSLTLKVAIATSAIVVFGLVGLIVYMLMGKDNRNPTAESFAVVAVPTSVAPSASATSAVTLAINSAAKPVETSKLSEITQVPATTVSNSVTVPLTNTPIPTYTPVPTFTPTPQPTNTPTPTPEVKKEVINLTSLAFTSASSNLPAEEDPQYGHLQYGPEKAIDGNLSTSWVEGVGGPGIGESLTLDFRHPVHVTRFGIDVGYDRDDQVFEKNYRVKKVRLGFSDGSSSELSFEDRRGIQFINVPEKITGKIEIVILEVYPTGKYEDTPISEVQIWGYDN